VFVDPDVLIVDEILAVGDESFQRRCYQRIDDMKVAGKTLILVSHALDTIVEHCRDCAWLEEGKVRALGPVREIVPQYLAAVREREEKSMASSVAMLHQAIPSGRLGVGITEVRFIGPGGPGHQFMSGQDFEVQVEYHSPSKTLRGACFSVEFVRGDGVLAFSTSSNGDQKSVLPGNGVVRLRVPSLPLMDGLYRLGVTISDAATGEPYTVLANAFPFRVLKEDIKTEGSERGVAHLDHSWLLPARS
jgi:energy-coupling factor transporter ATP-binding protein EcfA2